MPPGPSSLRKSPCAAAFVLVVARTSWRVVELGSFVDAADTSSAACTQQGAYDDVGADDVAFWDRTYKVHGEHGRVTYEWYGIGHEDLKARLVTLLPGSGGDIATTDELLVVGAGDSDLSASLAREGWLVTSVDFSSEIVDRMHARHPALPYFVMDARNMTFSDGRFSVVVDKGLTDCLRLDDLRPYFRELRRVLRAPPSSVASASKYSEPSLGGVLIVVSMRQLRREMGPCDDDDEACGEDVLGEGWVCADLAPLLGPQFADFSEFAPAEPLRGTANTIPYHLLECRRTE